MDKTASFLCVLVLLLINHLCLAMGGSIVDVSIQDENEYVKIRVILNNIEKYQDQEIVVKGEYKGWNGDGINSPRITRSDWVIQDDTGAIYVTGKTGSGLSQEDIGVKIVVRGRVLLNKEMVPYIKAEEISRMKNK